MEIFVAVFALIALGYTAYIDARTGLVPDLPLACATLPALAFLLAQNNVQTLYVALLVVGGLWLANELYYVCFGRDALGFGDAKWSGLAILVFGPWSVMWAWCLAAWLALLWMGSLRLAGRKIGVVYFAPFLFGGLIINLCALYIGGNYLMR